MRISTFSTNFSLSCEHLTNAGANYRLFEEVITEMADPGGVNGCWSRLRCKPSGVNGNPTVTTYLTHPEDLYALAEDIDITIHRRMGLKAPARTINYANP